MNCNHGGKHLAMKGRHYLTIVIKLGTPYTALLRFGANIGNPAGTSSIVDETTHDLLLSNLSVIVETVRKLRKDGHRVVIVSSGAIGVGMQSKGVAEKPKRLAALQALAAIGQCDLISLWRSLFGRLGHTVGQILLTRSDIADHVRYLNAQNTFTELLDMGAIPIVNENDSIAVQEIKFGDNDTLSAITAAMVQADYLFLMTDVDCLYDKNPRTHPNARPIEVVDDVVVLEAQADVRSAGSKLGTGGMSTKLVAARLATSAGVTTVITKSSNPSGILDIIKCSNVPSESQSQSFLISPSPAIEKKYDESLFQKRKAPLHTRFLPSPSPIRDRSFWVLHGLAPHGKVYIDEGAHQALTTKAGLFPAGIVSVEGTFAQQEAVRLMVVPGTYRSSHRLRMPSNRNSISAYDMGHDSSGELDGSALIAGRDSSLASAFEIGRAVVNYSAAEITRIIGCQSTDIQRLLGYADSEYVALRENISLVSKERSSRPVTPVVQVSSKSMSS